VSESGSCGSPELPVHPDDARAQIATYVIPVRYYANILRGIFLRESGIDVLWPDALVLLEVGGMAGLRFRKTLE
jgi:ABC-2 type transport system permease protein